MAPEHVIRLGNLVKSLEEKLRKVPSDIRIPLRIINAYYRAEAMLKCIESFSTRKLKAIENAEIQLEILLTESAGREGLKASF
jgi:hypothetical protein